LAGRAEIVIGEDVLDEVLQVLQDKFGERPEISEAFEWLHRLLGSFELLARDAYEAQEPILESSVRDPKDVPILAGAIAARADCLVSGDRDLLVLRTVEGIPILRTRDVLEAIERTR
jgi:putative PIN family toxin of toxin-antitoxin system